MSSRYMNDDEKRGYEARAENRIGNSRYDGGYDYGQGWDAREREERQERDRRDEERQQIEAEERRQERLSHELAMERQAEEEQAFQDWHDQRQNELAQQEPEPPEEPTI